MTLLPKSLGGCQGELGLCCLPLERRGFPVPVVVGTRRGGGTSRLALCLALCLALFQLRESGQQWAGSGRHLPAHHPPNLSQSHCEPLRTLTRGVRGWPGLAEPRGVPGPVPSLSPSLWLAPPHTLSPGWQRPPHICSAVLRLSGRLGVRCMGCWQSPGLAL